MSKAAKKVTDPRGLKRICMNCGARFYDMNKRPIVCPSCDTEFSNEVKPKGRKGRAAANEEAEGQVEKKTAKDAGNEDEDEIEEEAEDAEIVSLDDLETAEKSDDDEDEPKVDLDSDNDDDLDDLDVDDDLADLQDLGPDAADEDGESEEESKD